jgi:NADH:ubiquinone oxidoreductase subunit 5 (subunit L)/multisubunit Na+/H+ antiporter MnhA subunit
MKIFGWVLLVIGIIMLLFRGINFKTKEKVVDLGPVEINKTENHTINWPLYAGGVLTLAGVFLVISASKKSA